MKNISFLKNISRLFQSAIIRGSHIASLDWGVRLALPLRYAALLAFCLVLGIGNAWGTVTALSLPKTWDASDGKSAYTEALGCTFSTSFASDYSSAPKLKFNSAGAYLIIQVADSPDEISFNFKQNGTNAGTFKVQESDAGSTYTDALTVTWPGNTNSSTPTASLKSSTRYIKLVFVTKGSSTNAAVGGISITKATAACTKVDPPTVTATPGGTRIDLQWAAVSHASTYSVTCKNKSTGVAAGTVGSVTGSGPYTCAITGLTNGTEYTWSVMSVGDGTTYCNTGNDLASGDATPNVYYTVTWKCAGSSDVTTSVVSGQKPTFPSTPTSCDTGEGASTTFYGWATSSWSGKTNDISSKTIYTKASDMPTVTGNGVVYYAVFCNGGGGSVTLTSSEFASNLGSSYGNAEISKTIGNTSYTFNLYACEPNNNTSVCQLKKEAGVYIQIPTLPGKIKGLSSTSCSNASGSSYTGTLRLKSSAKAGDSTTDDLETKSLSSVTSFTWDITEDIATAYLTTSAGLRLSNLTVSYGTDGTNYMTTCCTSLGTITGSVTLTQSGTEATVKGWTYTQGSAAAESNISTYDVYLYSDADSYAEPVQTQTCAYNAKSTGVTFTGLSYERTYKVKIGATGKTTPSLYCDITPVQVTTINSSSTQTFQLACVSAGLSYAAGSVTKTFGNDPFTNSLTNSHSVDVTYAASNVSPAGCVSVNSSTGAVTINGAGSATITASAAANQIVSNVRYCEGTASYSLTVNKADITPTLSYESTSLTAGDVSSSPTIGGNTGNGTVTYAVTAASPAGCVTVDENTGVVTAVLAGTATVTATVGATTNYNGSTATATFTVTAASCTGQYCIDAYDGGAGITCFTGNSTYRTITNYVIPSSNLDDRTADFWIGYGGAWVSDKSANWHFRWIPLKDRPNNCSMTLGLAAQAVGTLTINSESSGSNNNYELTFDPNGYGFVYGSGDSWANRAFVQQTDPSVWRTEVLELTTTEIGKNYYVGLAKSGGGYVKTSDYDYNDASEHIWGPSYESAISGMGVVSGVNNNDEVTFRASGLSGEDNGARGFYEIWSNNCNRNFYCHFVPVHRIVFHSNYPGGDGPADTYSVDVPVEETNSGIALASAPGALTGYTFAGWFTAAEGGSECTGSQTISAGASADVELYAQWQAKTVELALNKNNSDAEGSSDGSASILYDATAVKGSPALSPATRTGYSVEGYYSENTCTAANKVLDAGGNVINSTVSGYTSSGKWARETTPTGLYTKWIANPYTVTLDDQTPTTSASISSIAVTFNEYTNLTGTVVATLPTKTGFVFGGYYTAVSGGGVKIIDTDGTVVANVSTYTDADKKWIKASNVELYAWWKPSYEVTWLVDGNKWMSGTNVGNTNVVSGEKVGSLPTAPTKSDCDDSKVFVGWRATKISGISSSYPGSIFTDVEHSPAINKKDTFYAVFADVTGGNTITLDFPDDNNANNHQQSYSNSWTATKGDYSWNIENFNNNNWGNSWTYIKCGHDKYAYVGTISTSAALSFKVDSVIINMTVSSTSDLNSAILYISSNADFSSSSNIVIPVSGDDIGRIGISSSAKDKYYKIAFDCKAGTKGNVVVNSVTYKQNLDTANYVTTCASCDADATFTNTTPSVSAIGCTDATLTMTGGLASLGAEGCHVSDYGFVIGTADNPAVGGVGVTKLQVGTADPTTGADFSYNATGLTKGTQYYIRAYATNRHGTAYSSSQNFWTKDVSSIAVTTAPTKTNYIAGESFDATGMVITATMADGTTEDVTSDVTFSSSGLSAGTNQDFTITYTLCETEKTATQKINVYAMTVNEGSNDDKGAVTYSTGATFSVGSLTTHWTANIVVTNGTATSNGDGTYTVTPTGAGAVSVTVNYVEAKQVKVYYKVDGETVTGLTQDIYESETTTLPTASELATAMAAQSMSLPDDDYPNFIGWSETEFSAQTSEPAIVTGSPTIIAEKTYYAVYTNMNKTTITHSITSGYAEEKTTTIDEKSITYGYLYPGNYSSTRFIQFQKDGTNYGRIYNSSAMSYLIKLEAGYYNSDSDVKVYACSAAGTTTGSVISAESRGDTDPYVYKFPANTEYFMVKGDNSTTYKPTYLTLYYCSSEVSYMTQFCQSYNISGVAKSPATTAVAGGTITADRIKACAGKSVTLTASVSSNGYIFNHWTITNTSTSAGVTEALLGADSISQTPAAFSMPAYGITVTVDVTMLKDTLIDRMHGKYVTSGYVLADGILSGAAEGSRRGVTVAAGAYTVPTLSDGDGTTGDSCTKGHYKFIGWVRADYFHKDGTLKDSYSILTGGTTNHGATGHTWYAVWAEESAE